MTTIGNIKFHCNRRGCVKFQLTNDYGPDWMMEQRMFIRQEDIDGIHLYPVGGDSTEFMDAVDVSMADGVSAIIVERYVQYDYEEYHIYTVGQSGKILEVEFSKKGNCPPRKRGFRSWEARYNMLVRDLEHEYEEITY